MYRIISSKLVSSASVESYVSLRGIYEYTEPECGQ